ncbi:MAG: helix-turn-helix domain-containing protein [Bacteroidia bacterium]
MENQFGERIKQLRETQNLLQRQVSSLLEIDTPMLSKIERGERKAKKEQVIQFAQIFKINEEELVTIWLADQLCAVVKDENVALKAMHVAEEKIKHNNKNKHNK